MMKQTLVMKFGGAATRTVAQFACIAELVAKKKDRFAHIAVVVSAMLNTTDQLLKLAHIVHPNPPQRECDMLVTTGERVSSSLLAMALQRIGQPARSLTGSQAGILTTEDHANAHILDVQPWRVKRSFLEGEVVVIAGFQGVSIGQKEITTLGRGGSDTSAVALAVALDAERVEFYKDVGGIFTEDPKYHKDASLLSELTNKEAEEIVAKGAQVLHPRALKLAALNCLRLQIFALPDDSNRCNPRLGTSIVSQKRDKKSRPKYEG